MTHSFDMKIYFRKLELSKIYFLNIMCSETVQKLLNQCMQIYSGKSFLYKFST